MELKARFCQQYFTTMLTMVNRCDVQNDDFGLRFLCEALPEEARSQAGWLLEGNERVREEELMLGLEEFWMITDERCRGDRNLLVETLLGESCKVQGVVDVSVERIIHEILMHFGGIQLSELSEANPAVREFAKCLDLLTGQDVTLFQGETDRMHRYGAYILYCLIGFTTLLRKAWQNDTEGHLAKIYATPRHFEMPEQCVEVHIQLEEPDLAEALHFMGEALNYTVRAKKYVPFTIDLKFGKDKFLKRGIHQTAMLTYYCWNTIVDVVIPKCYDTDPLQIRLLEKWS